MSLLDLLEFAGLVGLGLVSTEVEKGKNFVPESSIPPSQGFPCAANIY